MTTIAHGKIAPVLADGSSLLQQMVLTEEQSGFLSHDLRVLSKNATARNITKASEITLRVLLVAALITMGGLVLTETINHILALVLVIPMLFALDIFHAVEKKFAAKRETEMAELKLFRTVTSMVNGQFFNKTHQQKTADYLTLLKTGSLRFDGKTSYRLVLDGGANAPHTLRYVVG